MTTKQLVTIEELANILRIKKETLRRNCVAGCVEYTVEKQGKRKVYSILISSLPMNLQERFSKNSGEKIYTDIEIYSDAPSWARKQADKYLTLFESTKYLSYCEKLDFLTTWNEKNPDQKTAYATLMEAKRKYELGGIEALLSKHGSRKDVSKMSLFKRGSAIN